MSSQSMITSIRLGHATNSSSSHSIIAFANRNVPSGRSPRGYRYGWEQFTLDTPQQKIEYLCVDRNIKIPDDLSPEARAVIAEAGVDLEAIISDITDAQGDDEWSMNVYIDHESHGLTHTPSGLSDEEWLRVFLDERIAIFGGNDNRDDNDSDIIMQDSRRVAVRLGERGRDIQITARDDYVLMYDPKSGNKIRFSTGHVEKAKAPELVDVKITDQCSYGCAFCYQGSTPEGQHADLDTVKAVIDALADAGTLEIAIGGGEPTEHPHFADILRYADQRGVTPNFTTFTDAWLGTDVEEAVREVSRSRGLGIGVSVSGPKDLNKMDRIRTALSARGYNRAQVMAQTVVGVASAATTTGLMDMALREGHSVLLLGYKTTGRGNVYARKSVSDADVTEMIRHFVETQTDDWTNDAMMRSVSVDTAFLDQYGNVLDTLGIEKELRTSPEGAFSMYVDAVSMQMGPSSWHPDQLRPFVSAEDILPAFRKMEPILVRGSVETDTTMSLT